MSVEKPKPKQSLRPITTGAGSAMNQSQFQTITCNSLEAWEKSRVHGAIGFGFASHWLKSWRESFKPIAKRSNRNHVITFDSHLKTTLIIIMIIKWLLLQKRRVTGQLMWTLLHHEIAECNKRRVKRLVSAKINSFSKIQLVGKKKKISRQTSFAS